MCVLCVRRCAVYMQSACNVTPVYDEREERERSSGSRMRMREKTKNEIRRNEEWIREVLKVLGSVLFTSGQVKIPSVLILSAIYSPVQSILLCRRLKAKSNHTV